MSPRKIEFDPAFSLGKLPADRTPHQRTGPHVRAAGPQATLCAMGVLLLDDYCHIFWIRYPRFHQGILKFLKMCSDDAFFLALMTDFVKLELMCLFTQRYASRQMASWWPFFLGVSFHTEIWIAFLRLKNKNITLSSPLLLKKYQGRAGVSTSVARVLPRVCIIFWCHVHCFVAMGTVLADVCTVLLPWALF